MSLPSQPLRQLCSARFIESWQCNSRACFAVYARDTSAARKGLAACVLAPCALDYNACGALLRVLPVLYARHPRGRFGFASEVPLQPRMSHAVAVATPNGLHACCSSLLALLKVLVNAV